MNVIQAAWLNMLYTEIWVPLFPAHGLGSAAPPGLAGIITPSEYDALNNLKKGQTMRTLLTVGFN